MKTSLNQIGKSGKFNGTSASATGKSSAEKSQALEWQQERQERIAGLLQQLEKGVAGIQSSDDFKRWLKVASRFHAYSLNNQVLILLQFPAATRVAGYRTWQSLGRQVKRGSKGISILAPRPYEQERAVEEKDSSTGTAAEVESGTGTSTGTKEVARGISFQTVSVFDISQTEGAELPNITPDRLEGEDGAELYWQLDDLAEAEGLKVTHYDLQGGGDDAHTDYNGYYLPGSKLIFVKRAAMSQMVKTLAHELGHHFDQDRNASPREERETVAEAVAYVVNSFYGLDTTSYTFPYVAGWAGQRKGTAIIRDVMSRIQATAHRMLELLEGKDGPEPELVKKLG